MNKLIPIVIVLAVFLNWSKIQDWMNPVDYSTIEAGTVVMYGTDWCAHCKKMRTFFDAKGIAFVEYDVEKSERGREEFEQLGGSTVPVTLVGTEVIHGYDPDAVVAALQSLN